MKSVMTALTPRFAEALIGAAEVNPGLGCRAIRDRFPAHCMTSSPSTQTHTHALRESVDSCP